MNKHKKIIGLGVLVLVTGGLLAWYGVLTSQQDQPVSPKENDEGSPLVTTKHQPSQEEERAQRDNKTHAETVSRDTRSSPFQTNTPQSSPPPKPETVTLHTDDGEKEFPNHEYRALYAPNDYHDQWYTDMVAAPAAWNRSVGSSDTTVAVLDTGFALEHDELFDRWAINTDEMKDNGTDDDGNGFVDDWRGWDFYHGNNHPQAGTHKTNGKAVGHGTEVAGLVGAAGNNSIGIAAVNWRTKLLSLQVLNDDGNGFTSDIVAAIDYAIAREVDVINLSLGGDNEDPVLEAAIDRAIEQDIVVVAAAGNDGCNCMVYPAKYAQTLSVGATNSSDAVASFSSYGDTLDVVAPGAGITRSLTWRPNDAQSAYKNTIHGTSYAAPLVSGMVALLRGENEALSVEEVNQTITETAEISSALAAQPAIRYGSGRVHVADALDMVAPDLPTIQHDITAPLYRLTKSNDDDIVTVNRDRVTQRRAMGWQHEILYFPSIMHTFN